MTDHDELFIPPYIRFKITLAYDGTKFFGWQVQNKHGVVGLPTIQGVLEDSMSAILGVRIVVHGSGRTDAGVHAEAQTCHMDVPQHCKKIDWQQILNHQLPPAIRILSVEQVPGSFHANKSAVSKTYAYSLWSGPDRSMPRIAPYCWSVPLLDYDLMQQAAQHLQGRHDFASFQNKGSGVRTTVRTLFSITSEQGVVGNMVCPPDWPVSTWFFSGEGFLKQMVRNMVGLLVWVGRKKIAPQQVAHILIQANRTCLPSPSAPPQGLTLVHIEYEKNSKEFS